MKQDFEGWLLKPKMATLKEMFDFVACEVLECFNSLLEPKVIIEDDQILWR